MAKNYASTYLYGKYDQYEKQTIDFILKADRIDQRDKKFEDILYEVKKRQVSPALVKVLVSPNVIILRSAKPLSKAFKVFAAKDIKNDKQLRVFIDVSGIISMDENAGKYVCSRNNIDIFISYLVDAMSTFIYYTPGGTDRIVNNTKIRSIGAKTFAALFSHIVDYLCKISTISGSKNKCSFMAAMYYLVNLLGADSNSDATKAIAKKAADISDREAEILLIQMKPESFQNIKLFVETVSDVLHLSKMSLDNIVEKWMYVYGTGTVFALELLPAFSNMLTDAYVGAYVNNQKTIEKVAGAGMVEFTKTILTIGAESV